jgi:hypothetical protein
MIELASIFVRFAADAVHFASYGTPVGGCHNFRTHWCHSGHSHRVVQNHCVGRASCAVAAVNHVFGDP